MWIDNLNRLEFLEPFEIALPEFPQQVRPFKLELSIGGDYRFHMPTPGNLAGFKSIPTSLPFLMNDPEVFRDAPNRSPRSVKADKLRVPCVRFRLPS